MSKRYKGGVISATAPTTSDSAAGGSWTLQQQLQSISGTGWPAQPSPNSWLSVYVDPPASNADYAYQTYLDGASSLYVAGQVTTSGTNYIHLLKYNSAGTLQWQYRFGSSSGTGYSLAVDSSGNLYLLGVTGSTGRLYKLNSSGAIQWQKSFSQGVPFGVKVDSSGNIIVQFYGQNPYPVLAKLDSTGSTVTWVRQASTSGQSFFYNSLAIASSGNIYICGLETAGGGADNFIIVKYNSSGTIQWKRRTTFNSPSTSATGIVLDSSENVYVSGVASNTPVGWLYKLDSSGAFVWSRSFSTCYGGTLVIDSTYTYLYVTGAKTTPSAQYIIKFDTSGTVQWQRTLTPASSSIQGPFGPPSVDSTFIYIAMTASLGGSGYEYVVERLPIDGSKTGTYTVAGTSMTYAASSITIANGSDNLTTASFNETTGTLSMSTSSDTATATTNTATTVTL